MTGRLQGKIVIIVGAGQSAGETIGNGRAMAVLFARHGAQVLCVDRHLESAIETVAMITQEGGSAAPFQADVSRDAGCASVIAEAKSRWGRIDILVNNVGIGGGGDGPAHRADEAAFDRILNVNLKSAWMTIKHAVPVMREQRGAAGADGYADGHYGDRAGDGLVDLGGARGPQRARTAARQDGHRLGHRPRRAVPGLGRGQFHHRRAAARGRWNGGAGRLKAVTR